jgi:hypothetical protein
MNGRGVSYCLLNGGLRSRVYCLLREVRAIRLLLKHVLKLSLRDQVWY